MDSRTESRARAHDFVQWMEKCKIFPCRGSVVCLTCGLGRPMCEEYVYDNTFTDYLADAHAFAKMTGWRRANVHVRSNLYNSSVYRCSVCGAEGDGHHLGDLAGVAGGDENELRHWTKAVTKLRTAQSDALEQWVREYASGDAAAAAATLAAAPTERIGKWLRRERDRVKPHDDSKRRWECALDELCRRAAAAAP